MTEAFDRLRLARTDGVGPITFRRLLARYGSAAAALDALPGLARAGGSAAPPRPVDQGQLRTEADRVARLGGAILVWGDPAFPPLLAEADDAPVALSVLGDLSTLAARAVAVVGSRNASANGQRLAETIAHDLARAGVVVVSGMARGIDAAAHEGALAGGRTVACVAGGLDQPYPSEHAGLQDRIAAGGAVVSEAPLGTAPQARHFPRRNRIIAGLSLGVVVVEAAVRSGSLGTAEMATTYGRDVFAVPGSPLDPRCRGANQLLREGAHLTESAADVLASLSPGRHLLGVAEPLAPWGTVPPEPAEEARAVHLLPELLSPSPVSVDDLIRRCQLSAAAVTAALIQLELAGRIQMLAGNRAALLIEPADSPRP